MHEFYIVYGLYSPRTEKCFLMSFFTVNLKIRFFVESIAVFARRNEPKLTLLPLLIHLMKSMFQAKNINIQVESLIQKFIRTTNKVSKCKNFDCTITNVHCVHIPTKVCKSKIGV